MTQVHPKFGKAMTSLQYAQEWQQSAEAFFSASHYNWMSEQLGDAKKVIEVGCGCGASTEALVRAGRQVLVIESNQHCAEIAYGRLNSKGIAAELISSDRLSDLLSWDGTGVKLLVEDVLSTELEQQLPHNWFDAIVCWMTGSNPEHIGVSIGKPYMQFDGSEMPMYRSKVQERCFELGLLAMRNKGIVHVVDRAVIRSWADKDQMRLELAQTLGATAGSRYSLAKSDCFLRKLTEGLNQSSIQYVARVPAGLEGVFVLTSARANLRESAA